jgi:hypothetical protein
MSDFLSRLAARAVGEAPRVRPAAAPDVSAPPGDAAREAASEAPAARATPTAPAVRSEPPEVPAEPTVTFVPRPAPDERRHAAAERMEPAAETAGRKEAPPLRPPAFEREPRLRTEAAPAAEAVPVVLAAPVAPAPVVRRVVESRLERVRSASTVAADEPPVRVHIGRLEVRANLEQPPRQVTTREPARPQELTLSDYLRGRRSA